MVDSPSGRVPAKAPRWDLADTEGYGGENIYPVAPWMFFGVRRLIYEEEVRRWPPEGPTRQGARPTEGAPSYLVAASAASWRALQVLRITFVPKITLPKVSFRLDSV